MSKTSGLGREGRHIRYTRYKLEVITVAVAMRNGGSPWKDIQKEIQRRFNVTPTIRQMRTWWDRYGVKPSVSTPALLRRLFAEERHTMISDASEVVDKIGPLMGQLQEGGVPGRAAFWMAILRVMETFVGGRENLDQIIDAYREWRE